MEETLPVVTQARFRFFGELKNFLPPERQKKTFWHAVKGNPSIKDTLEALGVPHTEIDGIMINGCSRQFGYQLHNGDRVAVYPRQYKGKQNTTSLQAKTPKPPKFVLDSHLGKLTKHLRLLGCDCVYKKIFPDREIVRIGVEGTRIILTRDIGLLKNKMIKYGCWLRSTDALLQLKEVIKKYPSIIYQKPFTLCLECNGPIRPVAKSKIIDQLPPKTREYYQQFFTCRDCHKIYWRGTHYAKLSGLINRAKGWGKNDVTRAQHKRWGEFF